MEPQFNSENRGSWKLSLMTALVLLLLATTIVFFILWRKAGSTSNQDSVAAAGPVQSPQAVVVPSPVRNESEQPQRMSESSEEKKTISRVQAEFFTFEVIQCRSSGAAIACDLRITNNDVDRRLRINSGQLYDNSGYSYRLTSSRIANQESSGPPIKLFKDEPVEARVEFNNVSQKEADRIIALELKLVAFAESRQAEFEIQFRNLPLTNDGSSR